MAEPVAKPGNEGPVRPIVFLHLPKTAGMTLRAILSRVYADYPVEFIGNLGDEVREFAVRPLAERKRYALISGHMPWGAQAMIPGSRAITFLRDPVERVLSAYYFNKRAPNALHHRVINDENLSVADVIDRGLFAGEFNLQTNMLRSSAARTPEQAIESAKQNLRACAAFGLVERFDESIEYLSRALRWPREAGAGFESVNVTANRPKAAELDEAVLGRIRHESAIDRALYEFASDLFDRRNAPAGGQNPDGQNPEEPRG